MFEDGVAEGPMASLHRFYSKGSFIGESEGE